MKKTKHLNDLLAAIQRKAPNPDAEPQTAFEQPELRHTMAPVTEEPQRKARVGKAVQFWMHEEDVRILRELSAWLASQGVRPSDSLVVRTALRMAKTGSELMQAYYEAARLDGRLKENTGGPRLERPRG